MDNDNHAPCHERLEEFLERTYMAVRYVMQAQRQLRHDSQMPLHLVVETVFDVINATAASIWLCDDKGAWEMETSVSGGPTLPTAHTSWETLNLHTMLSGQVVCLTTPATGSPSHHIATANLWPGEVMRVLHVGLDIAPERLPAAQFFTRVVTSLLFDVQHLPPHEGHAGGLTDRQRKILELMGSGATYRKIASDLGYSESTIKQDVKRIFAHLGVHDRNTAMVVAGINATLLGVDGAPTG